MKKILFVLLGLCLAVSAAHADWKYTDIPWTHPGIAADLQNGSSGTTTVGLRGWLRDTTYIPMAAAKVDTTGEWTMTDCEFVNPVTYGHPAADTAFAGFFLLVADSAVGSTVHFGDGCTVELQVNYGRSSAGWNSLVTYTLNPTSGNKVLAVPITSALVAVDTDVSKGSTAAPVIRALAPRMRAIFTGGTSAAAPQTRIRVLKFYSNVVKAGRDFN